LLYLNARVFACTPFTTTKSTSISLIYRPATPSDAATVADLHTRSWQLHYRGILSDHYLDTTAPAERLRLWQERFARGVPEQWVLLCEDNRQVIGFACVLLHHDPEWGSLLDNLHVLADHQGRGIGRQLLRRAAQWVQARGGNRLYLWVFTENQAAIRVYEHLGGERVGTEYFPGPDGGQHPAHRYVWKKLNVLVD